MTNKENQEQLLEFPCSFAVKVMGINDNDYPGFVLEVAQKYVAGLDRDCVSSRLSKNGKYIAVTLTFLAQSKEQIDNIYIELNASDRTKMAL